MEWSFIVYIKTEDIYLDIAKDVETRFDISCYELNKPLPRGKCKKINGLLKDELGGKIMTESVALRPKTCSYLTEYSDENKKAKDSKKCVIKWKTKFEDYKHCLEATHPNNEMNHWM